MKKSVLLRQREERRLLAGHSWIFSNEIASVEASPAAGDVVDVLRHDGKFLGVGFYHPHSLIAVRLLSQDRCDADRAFFRDRIARAARLRERLFPDDTAYRVVHGESDLLPGLIVDRYGPCLAIQSLSSGMELRIDTICDVLEEIFHPDAIVARNDSPLRALEHLPQTSGTIRGTAATADVVEHGLQYHVDLLQGQKTGLFLDQKMNRHLVRRFVRGRRVLDCFCSDGGFSMNAAVGGATSVEGVDISAPSVERATDNARRNGLSQVRFEQGDVFEVLRNRLEHAERYGTIVLDPPSFTKNKKTVASALHGYRTINMLALRLLEPDGVLVSASCSHHIDSRGFLDMIRESALKAGRSVQLLDVRGASPDHPVLPAMPETGYLKLAVVAVT